MNELASQSCQPLASGSAVLSQAELAKLLPRVEGWQLDDDGKAIVRIFRFANYHETIAFVNATAWISHQQDHHPDLEVSYNRCTVRFSTHSIGGLSMNDFICAARFNALER